MQSKAEKISRVSMMVLNIRKYLTVPREAELPAHYPQTHSLQYQLYSTESKIRKLVRNTPVSFVEETRRNTFSSNRNYIKLTMLVYI